MPKPDFKDALGSEDIPPEPIRLEEVYNDSSDFMERRIFVSDTRISLVHLICSENRLKAVFQYEGLKTNESGCTRIKE